MKAARISLAKFAGTEADNLVFTTNAIESINVVAHSIMLGPGDEVLCFDHEYGAMNRTGRFLAKERGF